MPSFSCIFAVLVTILYNVSAAPPASRTPNTATALAIPLTRVGSDIFGANVFVPHLLDDSFSDLVAKYTQNAINYAKNKGTPLFGEEGAPPTDSDSADGSASDAQAKKHARRSKRGNKVGLTSQQAVMWTGQIAVGATNETFEIDFDTVSSA